MTALVAIALLSIGAPLLAQIRGIRGTVSDEQGQPLAGVAIVVEIVGISESDTAFSARTIERDQRWQAHTNDKGEYFVRLPHNAVYLLTASEIGFTTLVTQIRLSGDGVTAANVRLSRFVPTGRRDQCTTSAALESIERAGRAGAGNPPLARLFTWVASVRIHVPGCHDSPVSQIAQWSHQDLSILLRDLAQLVKFFERIDAGRSEESASIAGGARGALQPDQLVFAIYDRRFTLSELERLLYGSEPLAANQLLTRGAVLHADIAQFATGDLKGAPLVEDGGSKGWRPRTGHWQIGRELLDSIRPNPSNHEDVLLWYRAVTAHLLREARLSEVSDHLAKARELFPNSPQFLLDSGYLHQELSGPAIQAAVQEIRETGVAIRVGSPSEELQMAERFFRQAAGRVPQDAEARLRLGQVLGDLGRHDEARIELLLTLDANPDGPRAYLAELFLGRTEGALGRLDEASRRFHNAAALYPNAQVPRLALAQLARRSGDRATAQRQLQLMPARLASDVDADPWWSYYDPHKADGEELMRQLRRLTEAP